MSINEFDLDAATTLTSDDYVRVLKLVGGILESQRISYTNSGIGYPIMAYLGYALSPLDATTYFFSPIGSAGLVTTAANHKLRIPRPGTITRAYLDGVIGGVGDNTQSTISIRLNDTTDTTFTAAFDASVTPIVYSKTDLAIAVVAGDFINVKWVSPTWPTTNPTSLSMWMMLWVS